MDRFWALYKDKLQLAVLLGLSSALSVGLVAVRVLYSGWMTYTFLVWNLILAWVPFCVALLLWSIHRKGTLSRMTFLVLAGIWLLFFPNSPYIVTDFLHLRLREPIPLWYDLLVIFTFAWNGLILGFVSLRLVQIVARRLFGTLVSWLLATGTLALSGFGIYMGRFLRWNSWDLLTNPLLLWQDVTTHIIDPLAHPRTIAVTLLFSAFLMVAYATIMMLTHVRWQQDSRIESP